MKNSLSQNLITLAESCPYPLYVVGGRVRDFIAGLKPEVYDNDICAPADAEDFLTRAKTCGFTGGAVYKNTGTVKLSLNGEGYEFTSFRSDEYVRGVHKPVNTFFTDDITLDAKRRDFKCNAVYYDIRADKIVDPLGGVKDIKNKIITTVDRAEKVFGEDGLRLMRLARISAQTGFTPSDECMEGAKRNCALISDIAPERICAELTAILHADEKYGVNNAQYKGLCILRDTGVLKIILPELAAGEGMGQPEAYHSYDVLEHSLRCVAYADRTIRLAALLHDVGKPLCKLRDGNYHMHDKEGAAIALDICRRLHVSKKLAEKTAKLIALHMYDLAGNARENKVRAFIVRNYDLFDELLLLKQADFSACKDNLCVAPSVEKFTAIYEKMKSEGLPFRVKELNVRGDELIAAGLPKERTADILKELLKACAIKQVKNEKHALLSYALKVAN
ncbi:MAG: HD domain-containing protein [Clostridia bacterium]|nr:HD domain-containing protein [Clostridia bacterium]